MEVKKYIDFSEKMIERLSGEVADESLARYREMLEDVRKRYENPYLNVAIIGDFSSGKSTFINAFIRKNILKTAWIATTAIPTHIFYHDATAIKIIVEDKKHRSYCMGLQNERRLLQRKLSTPKQSVALPDDDNGLIEILSTKNEFAEKISSIKIWTKSFEGLRRVCIIDTPGVNPGALSAKKHVETTRNVLREYADATIILFQSTMVYTHSFQEFLEENASHFINDAVFVITMMDTKEPEEREEIIRFVRDKLKENFGLENPRVYGCSAREAAEGKSEGSLGWKRQFDRMRQEIIAYMNIQRERIIQAKLSGLLNKLFGALDDEVRQRMGALDARLQILEENSIDHLKHDMKNNEEMYILRMKQRYDAINIEGKYAILFSDMKTSAENSIQACTSIRGKWSTSVSGYMEKYFPEMVQKQQSLFFEELKTELTAVGELVQEYGAEHRRLFERYNIRLSSAGPLAVDPEQQEFTYELGKFSFSDEGAADVVFMLAGLVVGLPLAFADVFLGTNMSDKIFGAVDTVRNGWVNMFGDLQAKKSEAKVSARAKLDSIRDGQKDAFMKQFKEQKEATLKAMKKMTQQFTTEYGRIYQEKKLEYDREKEKILADLKEKKRFQRNLKTYINEINKEGKVMV